jgi:hypothetical protein
MADGASCSAAVWRSAIHRVNADRHCSLAHYDHVSRGDPALAAWSHQAPGRSG